MLLMFSRDLLLDGCQIIPDRTLFKAVFELLFERHKGLNASHLHTQLDPFVSKLTV